MAKRLTDKTVAEERALARVSKDGSRHSARWFETRGTAALLTMRVLALVRASSAIYHRPIPQAKHAATFSSEA
jgi:hypothetical protein